MTALAQVRERIVADGDPLLVGALVAEPVSSGGPTDRLAGALDADLAAGIEAIREGHLLHGEGSRLFESGDGDLDLLAGDLLYALGLELVAGSGDSRSIRALSELIKAASEARADASSARAEEAWENLCRKIGNQAR